MHRTTHPCAEKNTNIAPANADAVDPAFYLSMYPDLARNGITAETAERHYREHGAGEGRACNTWMMQSSYAEGVRAISAEYAAYSTSLSQKQGAASEINDAVEELPIHVYVLVRTSSRPDEFRRCIRSILAQTYSKISIIACHDTAGSAEYLEPFRTHPRIRYFQVPKIQPTATQTLPDYSYNLYCNYLLNAIPDTPTANATPGHPRNSEKIYAIFLDDDDEFSHPLAISAICRSLSDNRRATGAENCCAIWKFLRPDLVVFPKQLRPGLGAVLPPLAVGEISTSSVCFPVSLARQVGAKWTNRPCGDFHFFSALLIPDHFHARPPTVFIPSIMAKTQSSTRIGGHGHSSWAREEDADADPTFDRAFYLAAYPDLWAAGIHTRRDAETHYRLYGRAENRRACAVVGAQTIDANRHGDPIPSLDALPPPGTPAHISAALESVRERTMKRFGWTKLTTNVDVEANANAGPTANWAVFFGVYTNRDLEAILAFTCGVRYIIWGGSDIDPLSRHAQATLKEVSRMSNCVHIAISDCIYKSARVAFGTAAHIINATTTFHLFCEDSAFRRSPIDARAGAADTLLIFNGQTPGRENVYGEPIYSKVVDRLAADERAVGIKILFSSTLNVPHDQMPNVYRRCFLMLRLTAFDGNASSVQECKRMSVPAVHNLSEYGLKWDTVDDVVDHIWTAYKKAPRAK